MNRLTKSRYLYNETAGQRKKTLKHSGSHATSFKAAPTAKVQQLLIPKPIRVPWRERTEISQFKISVQIFSTSTVLSSYLCWVFPLTLIQYLKLLNLYQTWVSFCRRLVFDSYVTSKYWRLKWKWTFPMCANPISLLLQGPNKYWNGANSMFTSTGSRCFRSLRRYSLLLGCMVS